MNTVKKLALVWGALIVPAFGFSATFAEPEADAACGCLIKYHDCLHKVAAGDGSALACLTGLTKCGNECSDKKECKEDCRDAKKEGLKACEEGHDETKCPLGGPEHKECKKHAGKLLADCKAGVTDAKHDCKEDCK